MAIRFNCVNCGKAMVIQDSMAGKTMKCPGCKTRITVPGAEFEYGKDWEDSGAEDARPVKKRAPLRKRRPIPGGRPSRPKLPSEAEEEGQQLTEIEEDDEKVECPYCRELIRPQARKCRYCGEFLEKRLRVRHAGREYRGRRRDRMEVENITKKGSRALLYAIIGIFFCGIILEPVALIYGLQALSAAKRSKYPVSTGSATAAVVISSILLGLIVVVIIVAVGMGAVGR